MKAHADNIADIAASLGLATISTEELADQFLKAQEASQQMAEAVRQYFTFKNSGKGGSWQPIDRELTRTLWEVEKYFGQKQKNQDKAERLRRKKK